MWFNLTLTCLTSESSLTPSPHTLMFFPNTETRPFFVQQSKSGRWNVWVYQRATDEGHKYSVQQTLKNPDDAYSWGLNYINNVTKSYWVTLTLRVGVIKYTLSITQFTTLFFLIMSLAIALSLLAQGNTGSDLLQILDSIVEEVSEVWLMPTVCSLVDTGEHLC